MVVHHSEAYSLAMASPPEGESSDTSRAVCTKVHSPQNAKQRKSLQHVPSIPFCSLIISRILRKAKMLTMGMREKHPHLPQLSPTFSAVCPKTMHGQMYVMMHSLQLPKQPNVPYRHSLIFSFLHGTQTARKPSKTR